jgi:phosphoserine/homoserine phosphotransferase
MHLVCLDLEGVLVPEIWIAVAEKTGRPELRRTTREEPDYDKLMRYRLALLDQHGITLPDIQEVIGSLRPLEGALEFMDWLRARTQVLILSDTFEQFAQPLMRQLGWPTLFCHELEVTPSGRITGYRLRQPDQKRRAVEALRSLNYDIIAAGDSHNDLAMLLAANHGLLFRPTEAFAVANPQLPVTRDHAALRREIEARLKTH